MQVTVDRDALHDALRKAARALPGRNTVTPALGCVRLRAGGGALSAYATDLEWAVEADAPAGVGAPGQALVPGRLLLDLVSRLPSGQVELAVDGGELALRAGGSAYRLRTVAPEDLPAPAFGSGGGGIAVPARALGDVLERAAFACYPLDEAKPALTGVFLQASGGVLSATGCNGARVAMAQVPADGAGEWSALVPVGVAEEIVRLLPADGTAAVFLAGSELELQVPGVRVRTRLIDYPYPDIPKLLPQEWPGTVELPRAALEDALERVRLVADARRSAKGLMVLRLGAGEVVLESDDPEVGRAREALPVSWDGSELAIGLNAGWLLEGVRHAGGDAVRLDMRGPLDSVRVRPSDGDGYTYVLYPIRL